MSKFTVVDLFCGAGGLSLGLTRAGFKVLLAIDSWDKAIATYSRNIGTHAQLGSVNYDSTLPVATVFVGGPPCQGFSSAGKRDGSDQRNTLVAVFSRIVAKHQPHAFVFENVEGFFTADDGAFVMDLLTPLIRVGYHIHLRKINFAHYGVPQHRKRVIAIGGLGWDPSFPPATHSAVGMPGAELVGVNLPRGPSLIDCIGTLPTAANDAPGVPSGHFVSALNNDDLQRMRALSPGQTMQDLPSQLWHQSYARRAKRRVMDGTPTEKRGGAPAGIRRLRADEPSKAITSLAINEFVHPLHDRYLTLRECARIQTFPDSYEFCGNVAQQALQIGNAVPPAFGELLGRNLRKDLEASRLSRNGRGKLLSFIPTMSSGMSPALKRISSRVNSMLGDSNMFRLNSERPMALTKSQEALVVKSRAGGAGLFGVSLTDDQCGYALARTAIDLGVASALTSCPKALPDLYSPGMPEDLAAKAPNLGEWFEQLFGSATDSDVYFACLAHLLKARIKYSKILTSQPLPTFEQVGPRTLLQYGLMDDKMLAGFLYWRKWMFDIDNRAAQETGYLFEPILAKSIGGSAFGSKNSPIRRIDDPDKGRQVDCIRQKLAYEFKLRVTIAASGQGRWSEELSFPKDVKASGYQPVLVVFDSTANPKLAELEKAFKESGGKAFIGAAAWDHLKSVAGNTMGAFVKKYVESPMVAIQKHVPKDALPEITIASNKGSLEIKMGGSKFKCPRKPAVANEGEDKLPDDVDDEIL